MPGLVPSIHVLAQRRRGWRGVIRSNNTKDLASHTSAHGAVDGKRVFPSAYTREKPPPNKATAPNLAGRGRSKGGIDSDDDAKSKYHRVTVGATVDRVGRSGEGRLTHGDVIIAYEAAARDKRNPGTGGFSPARKLVNELRLYYRDGWGQLDNDRHGRALFSILLHNIANTVTKLPAKMEAARQEFASWFLMKRCGSSPTTRLGSAVGGGRTSSPNESGSPMRTGSGSASP